MSLKNVMMILLAVALHNHHRLIQFWVSIIKLSKVSLMMILAALMVKLKIIGWNYDLKCFRCLIKAIIFCGVLVPIDEKKSPGPMANEKPNAILCVFLFWYIIWYGV